MLRTKKNSNKTEQFNTKKKEKFFMHSIMRTFTILALVAMLAITGIACSGPIYDPIIPIPGPPDADGGLHLWGTYQLSIDLDSKQVGVTHSRSADYSANVTGLLEPANLEAELKSVDIVDDCYEITLDISITHPYELKSLNCYDVRGVILGSGSNQFQHNPDLSYRSNATDHVLTNADGYTRWFNANEFNEDGLFGYAPSPLDTPGFVPTAHINPFKYFCDDLGPSDDAFLHLAETGTDTGIFSAGKTNTREYVLRFPDLTGNSFDCGFALITNWEGFKPEKHPANAPESPVIALETDGELTYVPETGEFDGYLLLDIGLITWGSDPTDIIIESTILDSPYSLKDNNLMVPLYDESNYQIYSVEIFPNQFGILDGQEAWVIVQYDGLDYSNKFGVPNDAETDTLCSYASIELEIGGQEPDPGILLDPPPVADDFDWCLVSDNSMGYAGLYYFGDNYQIIRFPEDLSGSGEVFMTLEGNWGLSAAEMFGQPNELGEIAVNPSGAVMITTHATGYFNGPFHRDQCVFWFEPGNPVVQNYVMMPYEMGTAYPVQLISDPWTYGTIRCFYNVPYDNPSDGVDVEITVTELYYPYGFSDFGFFTSCGALDESAGGDIDGEVSATNLVGVLIDYAPDGAIYPNDIGFDFLEELNGDYTVESFNYETGAIGTSAAFGATTPVLEEVDGAEVYKFKSTDPECVKKGKLVIVEKPNGFSYEFSADGEVLCSGYAGGDWVEAEWDGMDLKMTHKVDGKQSAFEVSAWCW